MNLEQVRLWRQRAAGKMPAAHWGFMESPLSFFRMHWDHELPVGCSAGVLAGVLACECSGCPARSSCWRRDAVATRSRDGCATRFMESLDESEIVHCGHEPRAVPRRTKSADKSDALQTLRAVRRRPAVAKRLECVRLQRRFPKAGSDSMAGAAHGKPPSHFGRALAP